MSDSMQQMLGRRIARFRKAAGLTQEQIGDKLNVALETVSRMERGATAPSVKTLGRLGTVLNVPIQEFFRPEAGTSEREQALDDLLTILRRRDAREIRLVKEVVSSLLAHLDRHTEPRPRPRRIE